MPNSKKNNLPESIKQSIFSKKEPALVTKYFTNENLKNAVDYMIKHNSIIDTIILNNGLFNKEGIDHLINRYGHKIKALDLTDCCLHDNDIEKLPSLPKLELLTLSYNNISKEITKKISESIPTLKYVLDSDGQEIIKNSTNSELLAPAIKDHDEQKIDNNDVASTIPSIYKK